jgi:hypothetical protein
MDVLKNRFHDKEDENKRCRHELEILREEHQQQLVNFNVKIKHLLFFLLIILLGIKT